MPKPLLLSPSLHGAKCVGYLQKQGLIRKNWRRRWFILTDTTFSYCNTPTTPPHGIIFLDSIKNVRAATPSETNRDFVFAIETDSRTYLCQALSPDARDTWIATLQKAMASSPVPASPQAEIQAPDAASAPESGDGDSESTAPVVIGEVDEGRLPPAEEPDDSEQPESEERRRSSSVVKILVFCRLNGI